MFMRNVNEAINVLIVSENLYHQYGVECLVCDLFPAGQVINFHCLEERLFLEHTYRYFDEVLHTSYSFVFSGLHTYPILYRNLRHTLVPIFSLDDPMEYIREKLQPRNMIGEAKFAEVNHRPKLSKRESYLYELMMMGCGDDKISHIMRVSKKTISAHRGNMLRKLGYKNKNEMYLREFTFY